MARKWRVFSTGVQTVLKPEWQMTALLNCIDYKPHGRRTALLIGVNLSQNPFNISFPGLSRKCRLSGSAASKQGSACQSYSQSETGNKAILKSRFQVEPGNALGAALPQVSQVLPPNRIPSQRLGTRHHVLMLAHNSRFTPPRFCLTPKPPLPDALGRGLRGGVKSTWNKGLNVIVDTYEQSFYPLQ
jgi:hypothetical protein